MNTFKRRTVLVAKIVAEGLKSKGKLQNASRSLHQIQFAKEACLISSKNLDILYFQDFRSL